MIERFLELDGAWLVAFQRFAVRDDLTPAVKLITHAGDRGLIWIALAILLLFFRKTRKFGILTLIAMGLTLCVNNFCLKEWVARVRPYEAVEAVNRLIEKQHDRSFPSGHAASSFAAGISFLLYLPKKFGIPALLLACAIALSRLYVGVHYPSDVFCGALVGGLMAFLVYRIDRSRQDAEFRPKHSR